MGYKKFNVARVAVTRSNAENIIPTEATNTLFSDVCELQDSIQRIDECNNKMRRDIFFNDFFCSNF